MKYMVMECHKSFAIVLDEDGNFLKVANLKYQVGQTVFDVVLMEHPSETASPIVQTKTGSIRRLAYAFATMAAGLAIFFVSSFLLNATPYASMYLTINPSIRIDVDRNDRVKQISGENEDGKTLIQQYDFRKKSLAFVLDELLDRSVEMGYLTAGKTVQIRFEAKDSAWRVSHEEMISSHIRNHLQNQFEVEVLRPDASDASAAEPATTQNKTIVIPVSPTTAESTVPSSDSHNVGQNKDPDDDVSDDADDNDSDDNDHDQPDPDDGNDSNDYSENPHQNSQPQSEDDREDDQNEERNDDHNAPQQGGIPTANDGQSDYDDAEAHPPQTQASPDDDSDNDN